MVEYKLNRLESTKLVGPMVDKYWEDLRTAKERGEKVAWCAGVLFPFAYAMDMSSHFMAAYGAYAGGRKAVPTLLEAAEADGHLIDTCSYHRIHMGMLALIRKGLPIREDIRLPMPDLVLNGRYCTEHSHYCESIYRQFQIPVIGVHFPVLQREEDKPRIKAHALRQLKEVVIPAMEKICGRPFNYDRLSEILDNLKRTLLLRNECWEFFKVIPSPWTLWDYSISIAPVFFLMGRPGNIEYYEQVKAELAQRVAEKVSAVQPEEKYRIYWDGWTPWGFLGPLIRKLVSYGACPIVGRYPWEFFPRPEAIDPEHPVEAWVDAIYETELANQSSPFLALPYIERVVAGYSIDGLIFVSSPSCRLWNLGQNEYLDEIERRLGKPGVIVQCDMIDPKDYSEAQIDTRLQALFEMIDARRQLRRA